MNESISLNDESWRRSCEASREIAGPPAGGMAERQPPVNYEAEQALLGAILSNNRAIEAVADFLKPEHFADIVHARLYAACADLINRGTAANAITLKAMFDREEGLASVGGAKYLAQLQGASVTIVNAGDYGRTIYDLYLRRELIAIGENIVNDAHVYDLDETAEQQIEAAEGKLYELVDAGGERQLRSAGDLAGAALGQIEDAYNLSQDKSGLLPGIPTGIKALDAKLAGFRKGKVYVIAGRPGMGKTSLAENLAFHAARCGHRVAFFSLEMSAEELLGRELARITGFATFQVVSGLLDPTQMEEVIAARNQLQGLPLYIDDRGGATVAGIVSRARRLQRRTGLDLVVIDYLQLMHPEGRSMGSITQDVTLISQRVKGLVARGLNVPVILLSQLSRQSENRDDRRPRLSDLRESGAIEQDADVVIFLYRKEYYLEREAPQRGKYKTDLNYEDACPDHEVRLSRARGKAEAIIPKHRYGPTASIKLRFDKAIMRFYDEEEANG